MNHVETAKKIISDIIYMAVPGKAWMNTDGQVSGNCVDTRVEITLL